MPPPAPRRVSRDDRAAAGARLAADHAGVAHRKDLRAAGVSRADVRSELTAGRWSRAGRHTLVIGTGAPTGEALWWQAVWESGSGAVLDGVTALLAAGLTGFTHDTIDVAMRMSDRSHRLEGVTLHRRRVVGPTTGASLVRCTSEWATLRAAEWARTDRTAALLVCLAVQQRIVAPDRLLAACLPPPSRQVVRTAPGGRVYLDVAWEDVGLVVEIDGGHHALALNPVDDALRQNEVTLSHEMMLRIPVLGLRLTPDPFLAQVARAHAERSREKSA